MPFFDQYWQIRWLGAGLAAVGAVLLPLRYLQVAAVWDHLQGLDMRPDIVFAGATAVTLLGVAFIVARSARRARARQQWRIELLTAGVHPTRHLVLPGTTPDPRPSKECVITIQRVGRVDRVLGWMFVPFFLGGILATTFLLPTTVDILINPAASGLVGDSTPAFAYLLAVPLMAAGLWPIGTWASGAWASPPRFELDEFGITQLYSSGECLTIRWQDARLLEKAAYRRPEGRVSARVVYYLLYGDDTVMRIDPKRTYSSEVRHLLALIQEHTGLVPCQFDQSEGCE